jgi:hypothetical protein
MTTTDQAVPDAAVQVALGVLGRRGYGPDLPSDFYAVLDALTEAGWLHDPKRVAALEAVAEAAEDVSNWLVQADEGHPALDDLCAALGSLPAKDGAR